MNIKVKFCGIRRLCETDWLNEFCPDYAGFVFANTKRYIPPENAAKLRENLSDSIKTIGVFVNEPLENMAVFRDIISVYQLHGNEDNSYITALRAIIPDGCEIWKAVRVKSAEDIKNADGYNADKLLFDAFSADEYGGTGKKFNHGFFSGTELKKPFFLAGGLNAANITDSIEKVKPYGIDISSGIETDGLKDRKKISDIMKIINNIT